MGEDDNREMGVGFGDLGDALESHDYPATLDELLDAYGTERLEMEGSDPTLREVLDPLVDAEEERTYESAEEFRQEVLNFVSREAVGRAGYSDRGGTHPEETDDSEEIQEDQEESF